LGDFLSNGGCAIVATHNDFKMLEKFSLNFLIEKNRLIQQ